VVKRTPDKSPATDKTPPGTPKTPQPFFRKRTPKSGRKRANDEQDDSDEGVSPTKKSSKASKSLFEAKETEKEKTVDPEVGIENIRWIVLYVINKKKCSILIIKALLYN